MSESVFHNSFCRPHCPGQVGEEESAFFGSSVGQAHPFSFPILKMCIYVVCTMYMNIYIYIYIGIDVAFVPP